MTLNGDGRRTKPMGGLVGDVQSDGWKTMDWHMDGRVKHIFRQRRLL